MPSESVKQSVKQKYLIICGCYGLLAVGLWIGVGSAIHYSEGTTVYYAGACALAAIMILGLLCSLRVYSNIMEVGRDAETDKKVTGMIDVLNIVLLLSFLASMAGIATAVSLGINYCWSRYDEDCVNVEENKSVARGLLAGCAISLAFSIVVQILIQKSKRDLGLVLQVRVGHISMTATTFNFQNTQQPNGMGQGQGFQWNNNQNYPPQQQPNPYPMPQAPPPPYGNSNVAPPPDYYSATNSSVYPPPEAAFPPTQYGGFQDQGFK